MRPRSLERNGMRSAVSIDGSRRASARFASALIGIASQRIPLGRAFLLRYLGRPHRSGTTLSNPLHPFPLAIDHALLVTAPCVPPIHLAAYATKRCADSYCSLYRGFST